MYIKNNKGFSLIEVLVTMGLIGILTVIALPAYRNYRSTANETVLKADSGNAYKSMHAYNAVNGTFCAPSLEVLGLKALTESSTYTGKADYFVGFGGQATGCTSFDATKHQKKASSSNITATACTMGVDTFKLGVANKFSGDLIGFSVSNSSSSPIPAPAGTCSRTAAACQNKAKCIDAALKADCTVPGSGESPASAGVWTPGNAIGNLCQ